MKMYFSLLTCKINAFIVQDKISLIKNISRGGNKKEARYQDAYHCL